MSNTINLVFITDENYCMPTCVAATSAKVNKNADTVCNAYFLVDRLSDDSHKKIEAIGTDDFKVHIIDASAAEYKKVEQKTEHVSKAALLKFRLANILSDLDKVLYLDGDILVQKDLGEIYNTDLGDNYVAAVKDAIPMLCYNPSQDQKLKTPLKAYFNSGVMLLNLKKMREDDLEHKLLDYRLNGINFFMDQDALNVQFRTGVHFLPLYDNYMYTLTTRLDIETLRKYYELEISADEEENYERATILHLTSPKKPWVAYVAGLTERFEKYYQLSPYADQKFSVKEGGEHSDMNSAKKLMAKEKIAKSQATLDAEKIIHKKKLEELSYGLNESEDRKTKITVSLTTFPGRIHDVSTTLLAILSQTMKPDRVILWLTEEEFPQKEAELPQELLELKKFGLTIGWAKENLRAHTKYYYTMTQYPDDIVITVDDDIYYDENLVENLYKCHQKFPKAISALRVHNITFDEDGNIKKYGSWIQSYTVAVEKPAMSLIATGVGGVLYPPHLLPEETFDVEKIRGLSFSADDIWLKFMEVMNGVPVVMAEGRHNLSFVGNTQLTGLYLDNAHDTGNDDCIRNVLAYYSDFRRNGKSISELIYADSIKAGSETKGFVRFAEKTERLRWASASKVKRGFMDINGQINKLNLSIYQLKEEQKLMNDKLDRIIELLERNYKS